MDTIVAMCKLEVRETKINKGALIKALMINVAKTDRQTGRQTDRRTHRHKKIKIYTGSSERQISFDGPTRRQGTGKDEAGRAGGSNNERTRERCSEGPVEIAENRQLKGLLFYWWAVGYI